MSLALMLALQAAAAPAATAPPAPAAIAPLAFDLARLPRPGPGLAGRGCPAGDPAPIVVCARRGAGGARAYPLGEMARLFMPRPWRAELGLGGGATAGLFGEQVALDRGAVSNRVMIGIKFPF